jgi:hypothetical protein|nr:MAG TPA: hypothetical protein [Caudoviricetes sp.]
MGKRTKETITLGSGKLYSVEYTGTIPSNTDLEKESNILGYIQKGASLDYKPEFYEAEDDLGIVKKQILTKEEVTFKSGILTWNAETLKKLVATGRITEDAEKGMRTIKIGGINNNDGKQYIFHFVHEDKKDGNVRITIVGQNTAGFSLAFAKDAETVIDAEIKALPNDNEGTLIIFQEEYTPATNSENDQTV